MAPPTIFSHWFKFNPVKLATQQFEIYQIFLLCVKFVSFLKSVTLPFIINNSPLSLILKTLILRIAHRVLKTHLTIISYIYLILWGSQNGYIHYCLPSELWQCLVKESGLWSQKNVGSNSSSDTGCGCGFNSVNLSFVIYKLGYTYCPHGPGTC